MEHLEVSDGTSMDANISLPKSGRTARQGTFARKRYVAEASVRHEKRREPDGHDVLGKRGGTCANPKNSNP